MHRQYFLPSALLACMWLWSPPLLMTADAAETAALTKLFWCPGQPSKLQAKSGPGCQPLIEEKKEKKRDKKHAPSPEPPPIKVEDTERAVASYLKKYRDFLACCTSDPSVEEIEDLEEEASDVLRQTVNQLSLASIFMSRNQALVVPVAEARDQLRALKGKNAQVNESLDRVETLDYEQAGRERRRIQDLEDSINREFVPSTGPPRAPTGGDIGSSAPTGPSIGTSAPTGPAIGISPPTGSSIGTSAPTGSEIGINPSAGTAIGSQPPTLGELIDTAPGIERSRENTLTTTKPVTSGTVGPDIGVTPPTGPEVGNSSINQR